MYKPACDKLLSLCFNTFAFIPSDTAGLLQFEVCPLTDSSFSVSFQHPVNESLVCGEQSLFQHLAILACVDITLII